MIAVLATFLLYLYFIRLPVFFFKETCLGENTRAQTETRFATFHACLNSTVTRQNKRQKKICLTLQLEICDVGSFLHENIDTVEHNLLLFRRKTSVLCLELARFSCIYT